MGLGSILWQILDFWAKQWIKDIIKCRHWARTTNIGLPYPSIRIGGGGYSHWRPPNQNIGRDVSPASPAGLMPMSAFSSVCHIFIQKCTKHYDSSFTDVHRQGLWWIAADFCNITRDICLLSTVSVCCVYFHFSFKAFTAFVRRCSCPWVMLDMGLGLGSKL